MGPCFLAALSCLYPGCSPALAGEHDLGAGLALAHNSNITRTPTAPRTEWTETLFAGMGYVEHSADLDALLLAQVERRNFLRSTYQNDTAYFVNGAAVWNIVPRQLTWSAQDFAGESLLNLVAPETPATRTRTNSLSTGPEYAFLVNPVHTPVIGARFARYDIQGPGGNQRYSVYGRWLYRLSEPEKLSVNYEVTRANFTPPSLFPDFLRRDAFLRYERFFRLDSLIFEAGTTQIRRYDTEDTTNRRLTRVALLHTLTSESAVRLNISDQISDSASDLIIGVAAATSPTTPATPAESAAAVPLAGANLATGDVYRSQRAELVYVAQGRRIGYNLQGYTRRVDFFTLDQDYREAGGTLTVTWTQTDTVRVYAYADYFKRTFQSLDERDTYRTNALGMTFRLTSNLFFSAEARNTERHSILPPNVPPQDFADTRLMLSLGYSTGPLYNPVSRR